MYRLTVICALVAFIGGFIPWGVYPDDAVATSVAANTTTGLSSPIRILAFLAAGLLVIISGNRRAYIARRGQPPILSLVLFGFLVLVTAFYLMNPDALPDESIVGSVTEVTDLDRGPGLWIVFVSAGVGFLLSLGSFLLDRRTVAIRS